MDHDSDETVSILPPNPSLIAVLLVVNAKAGPRLVFHYPPHPRDDLPPVYSTQRGVHLNHPLDDDSVSSGPEGDTSDEEVFNGHINGRDPSNPGDESQARGSGTGSIKARSKQSHNPEDDDQEDMHGAKDRGSRGHEWETLFEYPTAALEKILCPGRPYHKRKFELGLEPLVYVGCPIYVREDGRWLKERKHEKRLRKKQDRDAQKVIEERNDVESSTDQGPQTDLDDQTTEDGLDGSADSKLEDATHRNVRSSNSDLPANQIREGPETRPVKVTSGDNKAMSMFHMVFVLNPPELEHNLRVREMYDHVAKKLSRALRFEQSRSNWVWKEAKMILGLKDKAKEKQISMTSLWHDIIAQSGLAKAISEVFLCISTSKIAHVFLNDTFDVSLQIPQISSISVLPSLVDPQMPGVWLTTADFFDEDEDDGSRSIARHFGLLLLDEVENILKDIDLDHGPAAIGKSLVNFIKVIKPTMSFQDISTHTGLPLRDIQLLSRHLVFWRRARAIPPLHQRDTYIVSPNADMRALHAASLAYSRRFPSLPSLPKMLASLSSHPRPYRTIIPSKDHRQAYLDILAWLMKGGWVTQLRTFAWILVSTEVKEVVRREMDAERTQQQQLHGSAMERDGSSQHSAGSTTPSATHAADDLSPSILLHPRKANALESRYLAQIPKTHLAASSATPSDPPKESHPRATTNIPAAVAHHNGAANPTPSSHSPTALHPVQPSSSPSKSPPGAPCTAADLFPVWAPYFDGSHALEKIALIEGRKRKEVWRVLGEMEDRGVIRVVRHW
ncbi:MAG: Nitrogen permease regulator 3 [Caeruleum heppii]|nr:MAG: Nitrogen permease regulator 3 [Caeruleum heppii]